MKLGLLAKALLCVMVFSLANTAFGGEVKYIQLRPKFTFALGVAGCALPMFCRPLRAWSGLIIKAAVGSGFGVDMFVCNRKCNGLRNR